MKRGSWRSCMRIPHVSPSTPVAVQHLSQCYLREVLHADRGSPWILDSTFVLFYKTSFSQTPSQSKGGWDPIILASLYQESGPSQKSDCGISLWTSLTSLPRKPRNWRLRYTPTAEAPIQPPLAVVDELINKPLMEVLIRSESAPSHSCTTNPDGLQVSSPTKCVISGPPGRTVTSYVL